MKTYEKFLFSLNFQNYTFCICKSIFTNTNQRPLLWYILTYSYYVKSVIGDIKVVYKNYDSTDSIVLYEKAVQQSIQTLVGNFLCGFCVCVIWNFRCCTKYFFDWKIEFNWLCFSRDFKICERGFHKFWNPNWNGPYLFI